MPDPVKGKNLCYENPFYALGVNTAMLLKKETPYGMKWNAESFIGIKNIISHQYGKIDDEIVFESITEELDKDVREFIDNIKF